MSTKLVLKKRITICSILSGIICMVLSACNPVSSPSRKDSAAAFAPTPPPAYELSEIAFSKQIKDQWCWAACGQMCMAYFGSPVSQCRQVSAYCNIPNSCPADCVESCSLPNTSGWPEFEKYQFTKCSRNAPLPWDSIMYQIGILHKPIIYAYHFSSLNTGHVIVICGYITGQDGNNSLKVYDPLSDSGEPQSRPYESYASTEEYPTHWRDYYNISKL